MHFDISKKWIKSAAKKEDGDEIGAGIIGVDPVLPDETARIFTGDNADEILDWLNEHADANTAYLVPSGPFSKDAIIIPGPANHMRADIGQEIVMHDGNVFVREPAQ